MDEFLAREGGAGEETEPVHNQVDASQDAEEALKGAEGAAHAQDEV